MKNNFRCLKSESIAGNYGQSTSPISSSVAATQDIDNSDEVYNPSSNIDISPEKARKALRKIDLRIVPALVYTSILQHPKKNSIKFPLYTQAPKTHPSA